MKGAPFVKGDLLDTATLRDTLKQHRVEGGAHAGEYVPPALRGSEGLQRGEP